MSTDEAVSWLRKQVEADLRAARIISDGGYAPQRWDTDPPGQVNPVKLPQADAITAALGEDPHDLAFPRHEHWTALVSWERENHEREDERVRETDLPLALVNNGRREIDHIIRHDPRNVVADCEAKLAIIEDHGDEHMCFGSGHDGNSWEWWIGDCKVITTLATAYKHRDGYAGHWGDSA